MKIEYKLKQPLSIVKDIDSIKTLIQCEILLYKRDDIKVEFIIDKHPNIYVGAFINNKLAVCEANIDHVNYGELVEKAANFFLTYENENDHP